MAGGGDDAAAARNKMVVLKRHVTGFSTEEDMEVVVGAVGLRVPAGLSTPAVLVKNLYLSCDPWMRGRMSKHDEGATAPAPDFVIGEVRLQNSSTFSLQNVIGALRSDVNQHICVCG